MDHGEHGGHDGHDGHGNGDNGTNVTETVMSHMMMMVMHGGYKDIIVFDFWAPKSIGVFVVSCLILFAISALYEGLKYFRERLIIRAKQTSKAEEFAKKPINSSRSSGLESWFNIAHVTQTLLHFVQITISYFLMLVFMTYNWWICFSVLFGMALGYFIFGKNRVSLLDRDEHCN